jgi:hypothetical protein
VATVTLTREEWETIIRLGWGESEMTLSTTDPKHARYMEKLGIEPYKVTCIDGSTSSWVYKLPADHFKLPRPKKRVSESQRVAAGERMRKMREASA